MSGTDPEGVRVFHVAESGNAVPRAFSADVIVFDHKPADAELVALLGSGGHAGAAAEETPQGWRLRVSRVPMDRVVPWMVFVMAAITGAVAWLEGGFTRHAVAFLMIGWLLALPALLAALWGINRRLDTWPDEARVDLKQRVLEIPKSALRVRFTDIDGLVDLWRWVDDGGDLERRRQLGVIVRAGEETGPTWAYHTLGWDKEWGSGRRVQRMNRVVAELGRPVREIRLSLRESKALGDAP